MQTILIGYADESGTSGGKVVAGPEVSPSKQSSMFDDAKNRHIFPEGVKCLEMFVLPEPTDRASFISDAVASFCQQSDAKRLDAIKAERAKTAAAAAQVNFIGKANSVLNAAAQARNQAVAAVAAAREALRLGDKSAQARIDKLQPAADESVAKFKAKLAARDALKNSKSTPEEVQKAVADLGLK